MGMSPHPQDMASAVMPGAPTVGSGSDDDTCPITEAARLLGEYASGVLQDDEVIQLFERLVDTGLIEYMNDRIRSTATALAQAGYIRVSEAEFTRDIDGQQAQQGLPNIQVRSGAAYKTGAASTAPVSTVSDIGSQPAQGGPAQVPKPPGGQVTSQGHAKFPDSGGQKKNPPKVPRPVGRQKAGPNDGDDMAGGQGIEVGNSLQQGKDPDRDRGRHYTGSQVGEIGEGCPPLSQIRPGTKKKRKKRRGDPEEALGDEWSDEEVISLAQQRIDNLPPGNPERNAILQTLDRYQRAVQQSQSQDPSDIGVRGMGAMDVAKKLKRKLSQLVAGDPRDFGGAPGTMGL
jgi:hypothetical protein